jgi:addiction module HigA family antidote
VATKAKLKPIHPGEVLLYEFLVPMAITQYRLAKTIGVPPRRVNEIVLGKRSITTDTALRLSRALGLSDDFWLNMQARYDIETHSDELEQVLKNIKPLTAPDRVA